MWVFQAPSPCRHLCPTQKHAPGHPQSSMASNTLLLEEKMRNNCMHTAAPLNVSI